MNNQKYWERRKAQQMYEYMDEAEKVSAELEKSYKQASMYIQKEAQKIFDKFKSKHDLTRVEAELLLKNRKTPQDIEALRRLLQEDKKNAELLKEYESQAYKARIDRLSNLYGQLDSIVLPMIAAERRKNLLLYEKLAEESYYQSIFDLQQYSGYGFNFKALDKKTIQKVLDTRWSGKNFSQTIWDNTNALAESVKKEILINLLTGRPLREAQQAIDDEFGKGYNKARRLVRTESAYVCNQIQRESYKACGIEKYIYVAILDLKTSLICRGLDKEVFPVSKAAVGVNYPPMHPWCRSTTIAYVSKDVLAKMKQSAIDPATGKRITVPGDMTYKEWYKKYVEGKDGVIAKQKAMKNVSLDKEQYEKYKEIFPDEIPDSLEKFKEMKYNNTKKWEQLKAEKQDRINGMDFSEMQGLIEKLGDKEARIWYVTHDKNIPALIDRTQTIEGQARQACGLRNTYKKQARDLMKNQQTRRQLDIDDRIQSYEELLEYKMNEKKLSYEDAVKDILKTATKTRKSVNQKFGLEE